jgi:DNA excision repair protein ERCC-5
LEPVTLPSPEPAILPSPEPVTLEPVILPSSEPVTLPEPVTTLTPAVTQKPSNITINEEALKEAITETNQLINLPVSEAESILRDEADNIRQQVSQQERRGAGVTSLINKEAQELLKLFGLPYIESPSEAEAQCAMLESLNLTQGTITDDNDVFLFGGSSVYRHVFSSDRDLMSYSMQDVKGLLGLDRNKLILLAYLLGSDYTDGIDGIGCVHATEMIQCFNGDGLEPLINMRNCQMEPHQSQSENALFKKIKRVTFPTDFPQENVKEAYINPSIDNSTEPFEWGRADLDLIRE